MGVLVYTRRTQLLPDVREGATLESHVDMLKRAGRPKAEIQAAEQRHSVSWQAGIEFIHETGGVVPFLENAVRQTLETISKLLPNGKTTSGRM